MLNRGDVAWGAALAACVAALAWPPSRDQIVLATAAHPYLMGFAKFAVLASMGELLAIRIVTARWARPAGSLWRAIIWGLLGMALALLFPMFANGIPAVIGAGLLPSVSGVWGGRLSNAICVSVVMNLTWAPTLMMYHRITDTWLDLADGRIGRLGAVRLDTLVSTIDWKGFVGFVLLRTIPVFWIPAHTITFLLPPEVRVLFAAFLSLALGGILAFAKRRHGQSRRVPAQPAEV